MSNHNFHRSAGPFTILLFYYFYYFTISFPFGSRQRLFAFRYPECRTTIFTGRPAVFASRVAKPECRTTIFTGRPDRLLFYYFTIFTILLFHFHSVPGRGYLHFATLNVEPPFSPVGRQFLHLGQRNLNVEPPFSPVGRQFLHLG